MENFTNETIDTTQLPKFEEVPFTGLHPSYWKITLIYIGIFFLVCVVGYGVAITTIEDFMPFQLPALIGVAVLFVGMIIFRRIGFKKKGFAFRNHDVLFRHGVIATITIIIPYNRIQHVALHEGMFSRIFGLATIAVYTAGGSSSDIEIPGIAKAEAENIKQLVMGKIQKEL